MPRIPTLQNQTGAPRGVSAPQTQPDQTGRALTGLASAAKSASDTLLQVRAQEQLKADQAAFMEADRLMGETEATLLNDPTNGAFTRRGKDALDLTPRTLEEFDRRASETLQGLKTDRQKMAFRKSTQDRRQVVQRQLQSHEAREREAFYAGEREAYKAGASNEAVTNYTDAGRIEQSIDKIRAAIDQTPGLSADQRAVELGERRSGVYAGVIDRYLANDDVANAERYYGTIKAGVNGEKAADIERAIGNAKERQRAKRDADLSLARQDMQFRLQDVEQRFRLGLPVTEIPSRAELQLLYPGERGSRLHEQARTMADASIDASRVRQMTTEEVRKLAGQYAPGQEQKPGDATRAEVSGVLKGIAERDLAARKADPAGYIATSSPTVQAALESLQTGEEGAGVAYFNAMEAEKDRLGITSPFVFPDGLKPGSKEWQNVALLAAGKYKALPPSASKWADSAIRSNDPALAAQGADMIEAAVSGGATYKIGADAKTKGLLMSSLMAAGADPERALQTTNDAMNVPDNVRDQRNKDYTKAAKNTVSVLTDFIDTDFDPGLFTSQPATMPQKPIGYTSLAADFDRTAAAYFRATGDIDMARASAWADLKRVYGPTTVNGENVMTMFPVERWGIKPEDVRKDIAGIIAEFPQADGSTAEEITMVADSDTSRSTDAAMNGGGVRPSYRLVTKTGDLVSDKDGIPLRYTLPDDEQLLQMYQDRQREIQTEGATIVNDARRDRKYRKDLERYRKLTGGVLR